MLNRVHSLNYQKLCYYTETIFLEIDGKDGKGLKVKLGQFIFQVIFLTVPCKKIIIIKKNFISRLSLLKFIIDVFLL